MSISNNKRYLAFIRHYWTNYFIPFSFLTLFVLFLFACGDSEDACSSENCDGCCHASGECLAFSEKSCTQNGIAGELCVECAYGEHCKYGFCQVAICDQTNCKEGCCDSNGNCVSGQSALQCGKGGASCERCSDGAQCIDQACENTLCNSAICPAGCCDEKGNCLKGDSEGACGTAGESCALCADNEQCFGQECIEKKICNETNCGDGCCDILGECRRTQSARYCGIGGESCSICSTGQVCQSGQCTCTSDSCDGCCQGDSCRIGNQSSACGLGGKTCVDCGDKVCDSTGSCVAGCNAATCSGCCSGNSCQYGGATDPTACGVGGIPCQSCATNSICQTGTCNDPNLCNAQTCSNGCCAGGICQTGTASSACGEPGSVCMICPSYAFCNTTRSCEPNPTSRWQVIIYQIHLDPDETRWLDVNPGDDPDPKLELIVGTQDVFSTSKLDVYQAVYDEDLLQADADELLSAITYMIWDEDGYSADDQIVECKTAFTNEELIQGKALRTYCQSDPQNKQVTLVEFHFELISS